MNASSLLPVSSVLSSLWIASLWQGLVLAAFTSLLLRALPDLSSRLRYRMWFAAYAACVLLPVAEWLGAVRGGSVNAVPAASAGVLSPLFTVDSHWSLLCAGIWAACSVAAMVRLIAGVWSVRSLVRGAIPWGADEMAGYAELLELRSRGRVTLYMSDAIEAPVAIGLWKPAIVLPQRLLILLSEEQIRQVLRHEGEHLERRDDWMLLLMGCMRCIFPLHPPLVWFERQLVATREMACDDAVLRSAAPRAYAMNLTQIAEAVVRRSPRVLPSLLSGKSQLGRRIEHILSGRKDSHASGRGPLLGAAAGLLVICALLVQSPALVAFQPRTQAARNQTGPAQIVPTEAAYVGGDWSSRATLTHAALTTASRPEVRHLKVRAHRPRVAAPHLVAAADQGFVPGKQQPAVWAQPAALLVLWNDSRAGFSTTLLFVTEPCVGEPNAARTGFFLLHI
ncbi:MAG: Regulatory sensor-transducer, BlaR1/MecR1 family [Acidobacteriaceae bacterium]|nr:Regulatory sensor-transducer, BlaR1/MecR1 family [Acidobacteriaceae bacterium]